MAVAIPRESLDRERVRFLMEESYVIEKLNFMGLKYGKIPITLKMFTASATHLIIPFNIGWKLGYYERNFPWECIQPLIETEDNIFDLDEEDENFRPFHGEFRDYQEEVIEELLEFLDEFRSVTLGLPPGWGKTMAAIYLAWRLGLRVLIVVPLITVLSGWGETCSKFMKGFKVWISGVGKCPDDVDIILSMDGQVSKIPQEIKSTIGTVIFDEMHMLCSETRIPMFLSLFPKYVICISATLEKANGFHQMSYNMAGDHGVFKVSKDPYNVYVIETNIKGEEERRDGNIVRSALCRSLMKNEFRQDILLNILMLNSQEHKIISLRSVKEQIPEFCEKVENCGISCTSLYGTIKKCKNAQVTIGTSQKMGTGYDEATSCIDFWKNPIKSDVMIFETPTDNKYIFEQNRGRVMRSPNPAIILIIDANKNCKNKIAGLRPWIKETNGTIHYVKYWNFRLPKKEIIYTRPVSSETFYRVLTIKEFREFEKCHIIDPNKDDYGPSALKIFREEDEVVKYTEQVKLEKFVILELKNLMILESDDELDKEYVSCAPICRFNVVEVHMI